MKVEDGVALRVWVAAPKLGGAAGDAVVPPKAKPEEPPPNADFTGVPKVAAAVEVAAPKVKGAGAAAAGVEEAAAPPKVKGLGAAAEEPKVG